MASTVKNARRKNSRMPRPKLDKTKESRIDVRMHPELRAALEGIAKEEGRTLSNLCERQLRQFVADWLRRNEKDATAIENLP